MTSVLHRQRGRYTVSDWEELDHEPDGPRIELIGGEFAVAPPPGVDHQLIGDELRLVLREALRAGARPDLYAVTAIGVEVARDMAFIPDIAVIRTAPSGAKVPANRVELVAEIVSPSTRRRDRVVKPAAYGAAGVPYYWRVEPAKGRPPMIVCSQLVDGVYAEEVMLTPGLTATTKASPVPVTLDPAALYDPGA